MLGNVGMGGNQSQVTSLKLLAQSDSLAIARGKFPNIGFVEKFGENALVPTTGDDIWEFGGTYTFSTTADIDRLSSSSALDAQTIRVYGLDTDWKEVIQDITLTGQTPVELDTSLIRVHRMVNMSSTVIVGVVYCFVNSAVTAGVPDIDANVRAIINDGNNQTLMCIYTIPAGKTGYFTGGYITISDKIAAAAIFTSRARVFGGAFAVKSKVGLNTSGSSWWQYQYDIPVPLPEKTDLKLTCDSASRDNVDVTGGFGIILIDNEV